MSYEAHLGSRIFVKLDEEMKHPLLVIGHHGNETVGEWYLTATDEDISKLRNEHQGVYSIAEVTIHNKHYLFNYCHTKLAPVDSIYYVWVSTHAVAAITGGGKDFVTAKLLAMQGGNSC